MNPELKAQDFLSLKLSHNVDKSRDMASFIDCNLYEYLIFYTGIKALYLL